MSNAESLSAIEKRSAELQTFKLGSLLYQLRHRTCTTLRQAALTSGVKAVWLQDVETGHLRPDPEMIQRLLRSYHADLDQLIPPRLIAVTSAMTPVRVNSAPVVHHLGRGAEPYHPLRHAFAVVRHRSA